jgi:hypothetical protein
VRNWLAGLLAVSLLVGGLLASTLVPAASQPSPTSPLSGAKVSYACPVAESAAADWSVVGVSEDGKLAAGALDAKTTGKAKSMLSLSRPKVLQRVTAPRSELAHVVSWASAAGGPERGLSAVNCAVGKATQWFTGVMLNSEDAPELTLVNLDATESAVDITIYGAEGRVSAAGSRGIVVGPKSTYAVPLSVMYSSPDPIAVEVDTSKGRVAAFLRPRFWDGTESLGADWLPPSATPASEVVLPGVPPGDGGRRLVVANPSQRSAVVKVELLGAEGASVIAGADDIEVAPESVATLDLESGLAQLSGALRLTTGDPAVTVTAALLVGSSDEAKSSDPAFAVAGKPLPAESLWVVPAAKKAENSLVLSNAGALDATVSLTVSQAPGEEGDTSSLVVGAQSSVVVGLPSRKTNVLQLTTNSDSLYGSAATRLSNGGVDGLSLLPLAVDESAQTNFKITLDPRVGS